MRASTDLEPINGPVRLGFGSLIPVGVAAVTLLAVWLLGRSDTPIGFPLDDAWIHMVYGRGLLADGVLAYNPGIAATGSTAPLWAVVLAALHFGFARFSVDAVVASVLVVGALLHILGAYLVARLVVACGGSRRAGLIAGVLYGASPPLAAAAFSGMEVGLCAVLMVAGVRECASGRLWRAGVWLSLAVATRPEVAAVGLACAILLAIRQGGAANDQPNSARDRLLSLWRLALPAAVVAVVWGGYNLVASGRPLPSTFYLKEATSLLALPQRLSAGVAGLLGQVPPMYGFVGWFALVGYAARPTALMMYPLLAGLSFLVANLLVAPPLDSEAFYHLRYLLPAVAPLIVALALGAERAGTWLPPKWRVAPLVSLLGVGLLGVGSTLGPVARHFHNDVRNINEVQRSMGEWLRDNVPADRWIAASDAGAVRYFSQRSTLDMMGLNTPRLYWQAPEYARERSVGAIAVMEEWFRTDGDTVRILAEMDTADYTVTSNPKMSRQQILGCEASPGQTTRLRFQGKHTVDLFCQALDLGQ